MDEAFHMCTKGDFVTVDTIWECGKKVTASTFDKNPCKHLPLNFFLIFLAFNLMGRYSTSQFNTLDKNADGKLNFDEFKRGFAGFFSTVGSTLVDIYDADGNGKPFLCV
jgi:hypothetical protein